MKRFAATPVLALISMVLFSQSGFAGWSTKTRKNCKVFARYKANASAGYKGYDQLGNFLGGSFYASSDNGCGYAHVGPLHYTASDGFLLAEAEASAGSSGTIGIANTWNHLDPGSNVYKKGMAGTFIDNMKANGPDTEKSDNHHQTASNRIFISQTTFKDATLTPSRAPASVVLTGVSGAIWAGSGYSTLEVVLTISKGEDVLPSDKVIWKGKAIVHNNRLTVTDKFTSKLFVPKAIAKTNGHVAYSLDNIDIEIPLEPDTNIDDVAVSVIGDAGNKSILSEAEQAAVIKNVTPVPVVNTTSFSVTDVGKDGKAVTTGASRPESK